MIHTEWVTALALTMRRFRPESVLRLVVLAVVLLNLLDAVFTLVWVESGVAREANLLLEGILSQSAVAFVAVKMGLVSLGVMLLWRQREHRLAVGGLALSLTLYSGLLLYHFGIAVATLELA